ncbi:glycoside hydrolase superfamily [Crepidotus variabilis]|uniref:chitinase n=1 Tax=Crepidotus variabilis TaxID=179855 RepID=A0A9P6E9U1_9AGAR|nr:glycoside hydrolase superfamily [Crepidotus variabilis]
MASYRFSLRLLSILVATLAVLIPVEATQVMHRPARYRGRPNILPVANDVKVNVIERRATGKTSFAYFTNWGIYGANFQPTDIVSGPLTHILYSFADVDTTSGAIKLTDSYADQEKHFATDSWSEPGNNLYGCLKQLYLFKLQKRNLKVLLSIGGWTYSQAGHFNFVTNPSARATFVSSAVQLIEDYGFDGIDIDFEYPASSEQGQGLADLLTALRSAFDILQSRKGDATRYLVTAAVAAGPLNYANYKVAQMNTALDYWNLMASSLNLHARFAGWLNLCPQAYDYSGSWLTYADNQANVYGGARTGYQTDAAIKWYTGNGALASKINLGMPLYGRAFENTNGLGQPYSGIGPGTIEAGIYSYKSLPIAGAQVFENATDITSYSYDSAKKELVSYDTPNIVKLKTDYIKAKGLAGSMFWELSTDKVGSQSLIQASANGLGTLDQTQNHISFPNSKWDNIRNNMAGGTPTTTTSPPTGTPPPGSGQCAGVGTWSVSAIYTGGMKAIYNGHLWTASWWTQGDTPGGSVGVWQDGGAC